MMTVAAIMGGLPPIMWTTGTGADLMKRIAAPMIGGMVSSTILTLLVIPVLYALWRGWSMSGRAPSLLTGTDRSLPEQEGIGVSERQNP
jgi:Cu/Ag efflux pump CusA